MSLTEATIARLNATVNTPTQRVTVEGARALNAVMAPGAMPVRGVSAYVMPSGMNGGPRHDLTGFYQQQVDRITTVIVAFVTGQGAPLPQLDLIETILDAITAALVGWTPDGARGAMTLRRQAILRSDPTMTAYEITLSTAFDLRIT